MKRAIAVALALACAACGESTPEKPIDPGAPRVVAPKASNAEDNEAPTIESAELAPNPASAGEAITLEIKARDAERDRLTTRIEWYRNGELLADVHDVVLDAGSVSRGDRVYAIAYVSDAYHEVTVQTQSLSIANSPPRVRTVFVSPSKPTAGDILQAEVNALDADGDSLEFSYRWYRNGQEIPAATSSRLPPGSVKRGDKIMVEVAASDGADTGEWTQSPPAIVANAEPVITSQPSYDMTPTGSYTYAVATKDADDDAPLRFELLEGPNGMRIDAESGVVSWTVPESMTGNAKVEIAVTDSLGGRATQSWVLAVDWNQPPANAEKAAKPKRAPAAKASESLADEETGAEETSADETPAKSPAAKPVVKKNTPAKAAARDDEDSEQDQSEETDEEQF